MNGLQIAWQYQRAVKVITESPEVVEPSALVGQLADFALTKIPCEDVPLKSDIRLEDMVRLHQHSAHSLRHIPMAS